MKDQFAGAENTGPENAGLKIQDWKCRTLQNLEKGTKYKWKLAVEWAEIKPTTVLKTVHATPKTFEKPLVQTCEQCRAVLSTSTVTSAVVEWKRGKWTRYDCRRVDLLPNTTQDNTHGDMNAVPVSHAVTRTDALQLAESDNDDDLLTTYKTRRRHHLHSMPHTPASCWSHGRSDVTLIPCACSPPQSRKTAVNYIVRQQAWCWVLRLFR